MTRGDEQAPASARLRVRLPAEVTRLVGRGEALAQVESQLAESRLVTIVGPPGIGKSRLALHIAHRVGERGFLCACGEARDEAGLSTALARGLGVPLGAQPGDALGRRLAALGPARVVLDDLEQAVATAAPRIERWLDAAPELRLLVTSRERLRARAERVVELGPLLRDEGLALFVDRVRAIRSDYAPSAAERAQIQELVAALDGIPLAIELAASRLEMLGIDGLLARLGQPLSLLSRGARTADPRHATLRGAIDASWALLDEPQREALARAACFRGGFGLAEATAVLGEEALDRLEELRERSLLLAPAPGRFALYGSIRAFAIEQLAVSGDAEKAERRHRDAYLSLGEGAAQRFHATGGGIEELALERDNLLAVVERALAREEPEMAARAVLALAPLHLTRGPAAFHHELLERVMAELPDDPDLLHARGSVRRALGRLAEAEEDLLAALELEPEGELFVRIRKELGVVHHSARRIDAARANYEAALPRATTLGDRRAEAILISNLGALDHDIGRFESASARYAEGLDGLREVGDTRLEGITLTNLGVLEQEQGRQDVARQRYRAALELLTACGDFRYEAITHGNLGVLEHEAGRLDEAERHHRTAIELLAEVGDPRSEALARARLGAVLAARGATAEAIQELDEAERRVVGRDAMALAVVRLHRCFVDLAQGEEAAAERRLALAQAPGEDGGPSLAAISDDARLLLRLVGRQSQAASGPSLRAAADGSWFEPPGGERQSLERYKAARLILARLIEARHAQPGEGLSGEALFEAGWPGTRIAAESANNRLYVALAKLRKLGLKLFLLRDDAGYFLDPNTTLELASD